MLVIHLLRYELLREQIVKYWYLSRRCSYTCLNYAVCFHVEIQPEIQNFINICSFLYRAVNDFFHHRH